jgi:hypothetical protein
LPKVFRQKHRRYRASPAEGHPVSRTLTIYRDDSTVQVAYENVKAVFWTAGNTVLVISQYTNVETGAHRYIHWSRERVCWFKDEPQGRADPR